NDCGTLAREDFLRIPELAINPLSERIVYSFLAESHDDRVNFLQFMRVLSHFRPIRKNRENKLNSRDDKLRSDVNNDQMISFEEFCNALERTDVEQKMSIRFLN
ncbi:Calcium-binding protein p22, partial [Operophtera brumata]